MWKLIVLIAVTLIIIVVDMPTLKKRRLKREIYYFFGFLLIGVGLNIVTSLHLEFPALIDWIMIVYQPISQLVFSWLS